jgi:type II secretory pathway pseudopilin PulG
MKRGTSLVELLAVMSVASVVFTVLALSIHALYRTQAKVQDDAHVAAALHRFARQLREDAHAAAEASLGDEEAAAQNAAPSPLTFQFDGGQIAVYDYHPASAAIRRRVMEDGKTTWRDTFALSRGCEVRWSRGEPPASLLTVVVAHPAGHAPKGQGAWRQTRIEAAVGLDRPQFSTP